MALVPQSPPSGTGFRVAEMVATGRMPYLGSIPFETDRDRAVVDRVLEECGVHHLREAGFDSCSGGEKERILLARASHRNPVSFFSTSPPQPRTRDNGVTSCPF